MNTKILRLFLSVLGAVILMASCQKVETEEISTTPKVDIENEAVAMEEFARVLSVAAVNEPELRAFLKEEALKKYDTDYDVFYPWARSKTIAHQESFRSLLVKYSDERTINAIENQVKRLTIFIPDWSWISDNAFNVNNWDTNQPEIVTSYYDKSDKRRLFKNGEFVEELNNGNFLTTPILIVKDNEKMVVRDGKTKASQLEYDFADEAFNGLTETKGHGVVHEYYDLDKYTGTDSENLSALAGRVANAYNEANKNYRMCQRDYVYYNMTAAVDSGWVDFHYRERITKIRLNVYTEGFFYNPTTLDESGDYSFVNYEINPTATPGVNINRTWLTTEQMMNMAWGLGTITLRAHIIYGPYDVVKTISIPFNQAFHVDMVEQVREENWLGATMWRSYFTKQEYLTSKWIPVNWDLFCWDLRDIPSKVFIEFEEYDNSSQTENREINYNMEFATNFKVSSDINVSGQIEEVQLGLKLGHEYGETSKRSVFSKVTYSSTEASDKLGSIEIDYKNPFITSINGSDARFFIYSTGSVDVVSRPVLIY